jgi:hypothetical protein
VFSEAAVSIACSAVFLIISMRSVTKPVSAIIDTVLFKTASADCSAFGKTETIASGISFASVDHSVDMGFAIAPDVAAVRPLGMILLSESASWSPAVVEYLDGRSVVVSGTFVDEGVIVVVTRSVGSSPTSEMLVLVENSFAT